MSGPDKDTIADTPWHALSPADALERLDGDDRGLSGEAAQERRERYGANRLPAEQRPGLATIVARQLTDPLVYVLLAAAVVSLALGNLSNAAFIFAVLVLNTLIGTFQERRAEGSAAALQEMIRIKTRVLRDGDEQEVDAADLVPGDVVLLEAGESVPADARLLEADGVKADESMLTGESTPVDKDAEARLDEDTPLAERATLLHAGSSLLDGRSRALVCRTGGATEVGRIARSLAGGGQELPLAIKLKRFTRQIALVILAAVTLLAATQLWQGAAITHIFFLAVALAVSAIPAGLPVAITVATSIATNRMAKRGVVVRQLPAVEGLGSCTLVASDKTGTLTANVLTVRRLVLADGTALDVSGEGYATDGEVSPHEDDGDLSDDDREGVRELATAAALCNEGELAYDDDGEPAPEGDSVDIAFLVLAAKLDLDREDLLEERPEQAAIPFSADLRLAASLNRVDGDGVAHVKGAAEAILERCADVDADAVRDTEESLAGQGYRVLAVARGRVRDGDADDLDVDDLEDLEFLGLAALIDPIRPGVREAIARCHAAGVEVRMITGDHPATGLAIARELGIADEDDEALSGAELEDLEDDADKLARRVRAARVFARVEPAHKTVIVEQLQDAGHFVAVTGDGVNDAPALKNAHIGVAMGQAGTDVARRAADLILTDDNFASIVNGIEEGRGAYDNVRKVTWLLLATGAGEVLLFFLALFTGLPLPLGAIQLLWLNLVTNGIQDVALAFEKVEPGVLKRPPRPPDQPVFDRRMIQHVVVSGGYLGAVAFAVYYVLLEHFGMGEAEARNLLLLLMVLFENVHVFSCRSEHRSLFRVPLTANPYVVLAVVAAQGVHIGAMYIPGLNDILGIAPVDPATWGVLLGVAVTLLLVDEVAKLVKRRA